MEITLNQNILFKWLKSLPHFDIYGNNVTCNNIKEKENDQKFNIGFLP